MPRIPGLAAFGNEVAPVVESAPGARVVPAAYERSRGLDQIGAGFQSASDSVYRVEQMERARVEREAEIAKQEQIRAARIEEVTRSKRDLVALEERAGFERQRILDAGAIPNKEKAAKLGDWITAERGKLEPTYKISEVLGAQQVAIDDLRVRQTTEINNQVKTRNQDQARANVIGTLEVMGRTAYALDDPSALIKEAQDHVGAAGAAAGWGEDDIAKIQIETAESWTAATVGRRILEDPAGALADMREGMYDALSPEVRTALEGRAMGEIDQRRQRAEREDEARLSQAGRSVDSLGWYYDNGLRPPVELLAAVTSAVRGTEHAPRLAAMNADFADRESFAGESADQRNSEVAALDAQATDPSRGVSEMTGKSFLFKRQLNATIAAKVEAHGALDTAQAYGVVTLSPLNFDDPESLPAQMAERAAQAQVATTWAGRNASWLTEKEIKGLGEALDQGTAKEKGRLISGLVKTITDPVALQATTNGFSKGNPVLAVAANMLHDENLRASELLIAGDTLLSPPDLAGGKAIAFAMPPDSQFTSDFEKQTKGMFQDRAADRQRLYQASRAAYAALSQEENSYDAKTADGDRWERAIDIAAGGIVRLDRPWSTEESPVTIPPNMSKDAFIDAVNSASPDHVRALGGVDGYTDEEAAEAIRDGGIVPHLDGYAVRDGTGFLMRPDGRVFVWRPGVDAWKPNANDLRADGSRKGTGWLGVLTDKRGNVQSERSVVREIDGNEITMPTLVPTLSKEQVRWLLDNPDANGGQIPESILRKADDHAMKQIRAGRSPFK